MMEICQLIHETNILTLMIISPSLRDSEAVQCILAENGALRRRRQLMALCSRASCGPTPAAAATESLPQRSAETGAAQAVHDEVTAGHEVEHADCDAVEQKRHVLAACGVGHEAAQIEYVGHEHRDLSEQKARHRYERHD